MVLQLYFTNKAVSNKTSFLFHEANVTTTYLALICSCASEAFCQQLMIKNDITACLIVLFPLKLTTNDNTEFQVTLALVIYYRFWIMICRGKVLSQFYYLNYYKSITITEVDNNKTFSKKQPAWHSYIKYGQLLLLLLPVLL